MKKYCENGMFRNDLEIKMIGNFEQNNHQQAFKQVGQDYFTIVSCWKQSLLPNFMKYYINEISLQDDRFVIFDLPNLEMFPWGRNDIRALASYIRYPKKFGRRIGMMEGAFFFKCLCVFVELNDFDLIIKILKETAYSNTIVICRSVWESKSVYYPWCSVGKNLILRRRRLLAYQMLLFQWACRLWSDLLLLLLDALEWMIIVVVIIFINNLWFRVLHFVISFSLSFCFRKSLCTAIQINISQIPLKKGIELFLSKLN